MENGALFGAVGEMDLSTVTGWAGDGMVSVAFDGPLGVEGGQLGLQQDRWVSPPPRGRLHSVDL